MMQQKLFNKDGREIGTMTETKGIYNREGLPIGHIPLNTNNVVNQFGEKIGVINSKGVYKNNNGKVIGTFKY